jgi:hypothetical protein
MANQCPQHLQRVNAAEVPIAEEEAPISPNATNIAYAAPVNTPMSPPVLDFQ